jgi:hypothetical protein
MSDREKTVGIFGDSFAHSYDHSGSFTTVLHHGWPRMLSSKHNFNILDYSQGGSSLFYSYKKFISNLKNIDVAVFVFTQNSRLYHSDDTVRIANINTIHSQLKNIDANDPRYQIYKAAEMYYLYLLEKDYTGYVRNKIAEDFISTCVAHDIKPILIPGFELDIKQVTYFKTTLVEVSHTEIYTQFGDRQFRPDKNTRACHLSKENNEILSDLLADIINGKDLVITKDDFFFKKVDDPETYWEI